MEIISTLSSMIDEISNKCRNETDTYISADGLLTCQNCDTPRQCFISVLGKTRLVNCLCKCLKAKADQEEADMREKKRLEEIRENKAHGIKEIRWREMTFDKSDEDLATEKNYCSKFSEMYKMDAGLIFLGGVGVGKTYRAACIANRLLDDGYKVLMINITSLCMEIQACYNKQEYIDSLNSYDLLIIDDIGSERKTEYMIEIVYSIIDARYRSGKPLIVTTNLSMKDLTNAEDIRLQRTYDRISEKCPMPIMVNGNGRRKRIGNDKFEALKEMLL